MKPFPEDSELSQDQWSQILRHEIACLRSWPSVNSETIAVAIDDNRLYIKIDVRTDDLVEVKETALLDVEPIVLVYPKDKVGDKAPAIWSYRADFPRDIGHINPTSSDHPASLCLAYSGLQPIYDRLGINGVIERLTEWLYDAKTGQLMKDGWEPVPMPEDQKLNPAYYDLAKFQEIAAMRPSGGWACGGVKIVRLDETNISYTLISDPIELSGSKKVSGPDLNFQGDPGQGIQAIVPWVFVWSDENEPHDGPVFGVWNNLGEIFEETKDLFPTDFIPNSIMQTLMGLGENADADRSGGRTYVLLLGVWRPRPLVKHIYGLSEDETARKLEIKAFVVQRDRFSKDPIASKNLTKQLVSVCLPRHDMLTFTSGISDMNPVAMIGYGALGSAIADFLMRSGIPKIAVMDKDVFEPHNIARHTGLCLDVMRPKVEALNSLAGQLTFFPDEIERVISNEDVCLLSDEEIAAFVSGSSILIDATADEQVRKKFTRVNLADSPCILRAEIFNRGHLGVLFLTGADNNPNLIDLYYSLCAASLDIDKIETWLRSEQQAGLNPEELLIGFSCASATTRMPKHLVVQHASAFMPSLISFFEAGKDAGIGINPLDENGQPTGWKWIDVPPYTVLRPDGQEEWEIRLSEHAVEKLNNLREKSGQMETGGYLYGGIDYTLKQIYVVEVSDLPPESQQSSASLELGPAGNTQIERNIKRRAGGKIGYVGTWHSHPKGSSKMSGKDKKTMSKFYSRDKDNGIPTLLVITSPSGLEPHLWT